MNRNLSGIYLIVLIAFCTMTLASAEGQNKARIKTILDYQAQLELTPDQVTKMRGALADYQTANQGRLRELQTAENEFRTRASNHEASDTLRPLFARIFKLREDCAWSDFENARRVEGLLTHQQILNWQKIQAAALGAAKNR